MNWLQKFNGWLSIFTMPENPKPSNFRRGKKTVRILGVSFDVNSRHVGKFQGGITPMKRRFRGVSRTAGHEK